MQHADHTRVLGLGQRGGIERAGRRGCVQAPQVYDARASLVPSQHAAQQSHHLRSIGRVDLELVSGLLRVRGAWRHHDHIMSAVAQLGRERRTNARPVDKDQPACCGRRLRFGAIWRLAGGQFAGLPDVTVQQFFDVVGVLRAGHTLAGQAADFQDQLAVFVIDVDIGDDPVGGLAEDAGMAQHARAGRPIQREPLDGHGQVQALLLRDIVGVGRNGHMETGVQQRWVDQIVLVRCLRLGDGIGQLYDPQCLAGPSPPLQDATERRSVVQAQLGQELVKVGSLERLGTALADRVPVQRVRGLAAGLGRAFRGGVQGPQSAVIGVVGLAAVDRQRAVGRVEPRFHPRCLVARQQAGIDQRQVADAAGGHAVVCTRCGERHFGKAGAGEDGHALHAMVGQVIELVQIQAALPARLRGILRYAQQRVDGWHEAGIVRFRRLEPAVLPLPGIGRQLHMFFAAGAISCQLILWPKTCSWPNDWSRCRSSGCSRFKELITGACLPTV